MTGSRRRRAVWIGAGIIAACLAAWWLWPRPAPPPAAGGGREGPLEGAEFTEARIVGRHRGQRQWVVDTRRLREESDERVRAEQLDSGTLFRDGKVFLDLQAAQAVANPASNDLTLEGDVVAVHVDGAVFRTDVLQWIAKEERLVAPGPVTIDRDGGQVRARRMEVLWADDLVHLYGDVHVEQEEGRRVQAERVDFEIDGGGMWVRGPFQAALPSKSARKGAGGGAAGEGPDPAPDGDGGGEAP